MMFASTANAQPQIISPVSHGIIQVSKSGDLGLLRVQAHSGASLSDRLIAIDYRFVDAYNRTLFSPYWSALRAVNGALDTTLKIPFIRQTFKLLYRIVTPDSIYIGELQDLAIGHVIGVAGQSNAEGWSPPPYPDPIGDVRVLRNTKYWEYGSNPSGKRWNGPWVYMANKFRELVPDGLPIGIVNTAKGGTGLVSTWTSAGTWKRNDAKHDDPNTVYGNAIRMFRAAGGNMEAI
ncbi:MAG TPA: sialate O-acetylesterase, partial [Candidatus Kapabacteria bacterium]|nr:sialate O-acetylesterase [Candidatus Kapabacteria bacterium]